MRTNIIILLSLIASCLLAQPDLVESVPNAPPTSVNTAPQEGVNMPPVDMELAPTKSSQEVWLSLGVLVFGMVVILAQAFLISKREEALSESLKYLGVTLIIVGSLFLVTAGYGNSQIAPIIGLLGTVAGYLLGRTQPTTK